MKIGIFGGTFDPFTKAHLAICERVLELDLVDEVYVLPTVVSWHRKDKCVWLKEYEKMDVIDKITWSSKYRDRIKLDFYEIMSFSKDHPDLVDSRRYVHMLSDFTLHHGIENEYYTIIGTDSLWNFDSWWKHKAILEMSELIAVSGRDGILLPDQTFGARIIDIGKEYLNISATQIRKEFKTAQKYLESLGLS